MCGVEREREREKKSCSKKNINSFQDVSVEKDFEVSVTEFVDWLHYCMYL
jgi:hypothetical protein